MVVLSRKAQEVIVLTIPPSTEPREIRVMVTEVRGGKVKLGTTADRDVIVDRLEIHEARNAS